MPRRVVQVRVNAEIIAGMFFPSFPGAWSRTDRGLPPDAKCVGCGYDWEPHRFWFVFEHESFAEIPNGECPPEFRGVELSAVHFAAPVDAPQVAMIERLTAEQVTRAEASQTKPDHVREENSPTPAKPPRYAVLNAAGEIIAESDDKAEAFAAMCAGGATLRDRDIKPRINTFVGTFTELPGQPK